VSTPIKLGHRVEVVRAAKGISRSRLAEILKIDRSTVTKWATVGTAPRNLEAVAEALEVDIAAIYAARPAAKRRAAA
jgi:transcriptional regulator with XRE-family HTH domain